jgi:hypothetical protein
MKKLKLDNLKNTPFNYSHIPFAESKGILIGDENKGVVIPVIQNEASITSSFYRPISKIDIEHEEK